MTSLVPNNFGPERAYGGAPAGPVPGNFGFNGPPDPSYDFSAGGLDAYAQAVNYGEAPFSHGSISLKSVDFIQHQYMVPPMYDGIARKIMPEMLVFSVNEMDPDEGSNIIFSMADINKIMQQQWDDFERARHVANNNNNNNVYHDPEAEEFQQWLAAYGERGLEDYAYARKHPHIAPTNTGYDSAAAATALSSFLHRATAPGYCYLTRYGILQKLSFLGVCINTNRAVGLETEDNTDATDHYTQVNVGIGKRVRTANVFGSAGDITTGSKLWVKLTRRRCRDGSYGAFCLVPGGSRTHDSPLFRELCYRDEAGMMCTGYTWRVGVVIEPGDRDPRPAALEQAAGTGYHVSQTVAYEAHGMLPSMYVAVGFKH